MPRFVGSQRRSLLGPDRSASELAATASERHRGVKQPLQQKRIVGWLERTALESLTTLLLWRARRRVRPFALPWRIFSSAAVSITY